ncbi:hypothetical protein Ae706Ps2_6405c [Pseudonocardia sp. Ae706_Ps2]|nr:hypothetical protein Ae706Ps2_6405c [Pseudonocardia sp. Ae706_Ps2]
MITPVIPGFTDDGVDLPVGDLSTPMPPTGTSREVHPDGPVVEPRLDPIPDRHHLPARANTVHPPDRLRLDPAESDQLFPQPFR